MSDHLSVELNMARRNISDVLGEDMKLWVCHSFPHEKYKMQHWLLSLTVMCNVALMCILVAYWLISLFYFSQSCDAALQVYSLSFLSRVIFWSLCWFNTSFRLFSLLLICFYYCLASHFVKCIVFHGRTRLPFHGNYQYSVWL